MNHKTIITELRRINAWRRGDETVGQPAPGHFGDVLDAAAESLASLVASNTTLREQRDAARAELKQRKADVTRMEEYLRNSGRNMDEAQDQIAERDASVADMSADLARVTAERDHAQGITEKLPNVSVPQPCQMRAELAEASLKVAREQISALRARVAELEAEAKKFPWELAGKTTRLEQRNAELVVALRGALGWLEKGGVRSAHVALANALARAESSTQAVVQDSLTTGATPSKHPDTERLDWLLANGDPLVAWINTDSIVVESRAAIDAARKQGGEK